MPDRQPRIVVIGAGFGGLKAARALAKLPVRITLIDRKNHHTFQPLLYQVATAGISPAEIAAPVRWILRGRKNVEVLLGEVVDFDLDEWEPLAPGLKTIEDALEIRRRVLLAFELAERQAIAKEPQLPLNFVIVGAGPTGVELAGTLAEIARQALRKEFRSIDPKHTRII